MFDPPHAEAFLERVNAAMIRTRRRGTLLAVGVLQVGVPTETDCKALKRKLLGALSASDMIDMIGLGVYGLIVANIENVHDIATRMERIAPVLEAHCNKVVRLSAPPSLVLSLHPTNSPSIIVTRDLLYQADSVLAMAQTNRSEKRRFWGWDWECVLEKNT
ncbi:hypothetical protein HAP94_11230 [Acidithiobacillus ferrivorans]|nr:hypothetical protein [Acidithiobacillus ferrivorans]